MFTEFEAGLGQVLVGRDPLLLQPGDRRLREAGAPEVGVRLPCHSPSARASSSARSRGPASLRGRRELREALGVHGPRRSAQGVAGRTVRDQGACAVLGLGEDPAELGDLGLEGVPRVAGGGVARLAPQVLDQPVHRHGPAVAYEEGREQGPYLRFGNGHGSPVVRADGQWPQHLETHAATLLLARQTPCVRP